MYFLALATDYDGTLAHNGVVDAATCAALRRFKDTGRRLVLVTGRELPELKRVFPEIAIFDQVVAENGALIYDPSTGDERVLAPAPPADFVEMLRARKVEPVSVGRSIVATWEPHENAVLSAIRDLGLELQIIFNKGAVMVLPAGINKAVGLEAVLAELDLSAHNVVGVGDAENDHAFLRACGCAAAVANALPMVKAQADIVLDNDHGAGVVELMERIVREDARMVPPARHGVLVGIDRAGKELYLEPHRGSVLICGGSGTGKSMFATTLTERMAEKKFEFCIFDPEGDYNDLDNAVVVGNARTPPSADQAIKILRDAEVNVVINVQALGLPERRAFFSTLRRQISDLRARTGRPHWVLVDEAHQLLPAARGRASTDRLHDIPAAIFITIHPEGLAAEVLKTIEIVLAFGGTALGLVTSFGRALSIAVPAGAPAPADAEFLFWDRHSAEPPRAVAAERPRQAHKRHTGKYAEGDVGAERSFYFRGPGNELNLRAHNLIAFLNIAQTIDDAAWEYHLRAGDYSAWFRHVIKDEDLAREAAEVEADSTLDARQSRSRIGKAVRQRYTTPAAPN